jgi:hypothetical protein
VGFDWDPLALPKPEHADQFGVLLARLQATGDETILDRLNAISTPVFETLGAPRVGFDVEADDWLLERVGEDDHYEMCMKMQGYYVLDLLPPCDGFPVYTTDKPWPSLGRYTFRGAALAEARGVLGDLYDEAFRYHSTAQLEEYGERLMACGRAFARKHRIMEVELLRSGDFKKHSKQSRAHIVLAAARWCLYWARRGHGLAPLT